ncbi:MAG: tetratricopeptide repeat protein [Actinobacteria bacterium]|nr:tetratricopeptide repeat protein [Actinomycetota bacterium]
MMRIQPLSVRNLLEQLRAERRLRQRVAALTAMSVFFASALIAVGLGQIVLVLAVLAAVAAGVALAVRAVSHHDLQRVLRAAGSVQRRQRVSALVTRTVAVARTQRTHAVRQTRRLAAKAAPRVPQAVPSRARQVVSPPSAEELYGWPYAGSEEVAARAPRSQPKIDDERRRALELNARGAQLRRAGNPAPAAALHLEALEIFLSLDDRHAQAPTLNSLALALAAAGETDAAVERFEQSLLILRERPDDPEHGKVIANLGFTLLRQGADDRGRELLCEALEKLPPESPAAHKVEAQLRRAS